MNVDDVLQHLPNFELDGAGPYVPPIKQYFEYYGLNFEDKMELVAHSFGLIEAGGYQIACHYYQQKSSANRECVLIIHGLYDHAGLYNNLIESCLLSGLDVLIFDLPGHGLSSGQRGAIGSFEEYQVVLKDVAAHFSFANITALIGQSTGAAIVMHYLFDYPQAKLKAVLLAPLLKPYRWRQTKILYSVLKGLVKRVPRRFSKNNADERFLQFIEHDDPLQCKYTHLSWVASLIGWVDGFKYFKSNRSDVLVIQGKNDNTVDWKNNMPVIQKKLINAKVEYIDGAGHHLVKEIKETRDEVFAFINQYLNKA